MDTLPAGSRPAGGSLPPGEADGCVDTAMRSARSQGRVPHFGSREVRALRGCPAGLVVRTWGPGARMAPVAVTNPGASVKRDVGIMEAGPAGLFAANVLVRADMDCVDFETPRRGRRPRPCRAGLIGQRTAWLLERHGLAAGRLRGARPSGVRVRPGRKAACFDYAALGGAAHHLYPQQFLVDPLRSAGGEIQFGCGLPGPGGSATILAPDAPAVTTASGGPPRTGTWARRSRCSPMRGPVWARAPVLREG